MIDEKNMTFDDRTQPGDRLIPLQARYSCLFRIKRFRRNCLIR